jgi:hypothetical protein
MWTVVVVALLSTVFVAAGSASLQRSAHTARTAIYPTLYVNYTDNCTFTIVNDSGSPVSSIPPGNYQVQVNTPIMFKLLADQGIPAGSMVACGIGWVQFQMTGPGVNLSTTLTVGCDSSDTFPAVYFAPNSTFVAQDLAQPSVTRTTISTLASGAPTNPTSSSANLPTSTTSSGGLSALGTPLSGKAPAKLGSLGATVSSAGKVTLSYKSKPVATLAAGSYTLSVTSKSKSTGFEIAHAGHKATIVKGLGTHSVAVTLTGGQWYFASSTGKSKIYFFVS